LDISHVPVDMIAEFFLIEKDSKYKAEVILLIDIGTHDEVY
jgi:hypothetical protein